MSNSMFSTQFTSTTGSITKCGRTYTYDLDSGKLYNNNRMWDIKSFEDAVAIVRHRTRRF